MRGKMFDKKAWKKAYDQKPEVKQKAKERRKVYYWAHREAEAERQRNWFWKPYHQRERQQLIKTAVLMHYSNPIGSTVCNNCGEQDIEVLCLDHVKGGGNKHRRIIGSAYYDWIIKTGYPEGYQVLCYNCNIRKRRFDVQSVKFSENLEIN